MKYLPTLHTHTTHHVHTYKCDPATTLLPNFSDLSLSLSLSLLPFPRTPRRTPSVRLRPSVLPKYFFALCAKLIFVVGVLVCACACGRLQLTRKGTRDREEATFIREWRRTSAFVWVCVSVCDSFHFLKRPFRRRYFIGGPQKYDDENSHNAGSGT